jgi:hypothetical protein
LDEECSRFLDKRKQAIIQWLQDPNQSSVGNLDSVRDKDSRLFRNKKKDYLKAKIDGFEINSNQKCLRLVQGHQ